MKKIIFDSIVAVIHLNLTLYQVLKLDDQSFGGQVARMGIKIEPVINFFGGYLYPILN